MNNKNRKFVKFLVSILVFSMVFIWMFNFLIDPYGYNKIFIFNGNKEKLVRDERSSKFDLLIKNKKASSFIFGSSRALVLDAAKLTKLTNTESLNLAFSSASSAEYYLFIKYLLETRKVSNIIIGIDLFAYTKNFNSNGVMPQKLLSYFDMENDVSSKKYLSIKMFRRSIDVINKNYSSEFKSKHSYTDRGKIIRKNYLEIKNNKFEFEKYITKHVKEGTEHWGSKNSELSVEHLDNLVKIKKMCDKYKANLHLFMSPLYIKQIMMKNNRFEQQKKLLRFVVDNISPVMSYNGITKINTDPYSFRDVFHYSDDVGDYILENFFSKKLKKSVYYITKENVDVHFENINKKIQKL